MYTSHSIGTGTAIDVKAGASHVCILRANNTTTVTGSGEVLCWGQGSYGQLVSRLHMLRSRSVEHTPCHVAVAKYFFAASYVL
jgi:alpha-tubulin suppressor-like RCC1 family protein